MTSEPINTPFSEVAGDAATNGLTRLSTTTTPESRARIAYTAYGRKVDFKNRGEPMPAFDDLGEMSRGAWIAAAGVIWDLATTGHATI